MRILACVVLLAGLAAAKEEFNPRVGAVGDFPREIGRGKKVVISGETKGAYRSPELIIIAPDGKTFLNKDNRVTDHRFVFTIAFDHGSGPYRCEIIARKSNLIRWFARFTIWHGRPRPAEEKIEPPPDHPDTPVTLHERLIEKRICGILNRFRKQVGVPQLPWNEAVAARAREHCGRIAKAERLLNRIGGVGVRELLAKSGGGGGLSGPHMEWPGMSGSRPFPRPTPMEPLERLRNYTVAFLARDGSLEQMIHETFVTEAAYRICALDPFALEMAVGVARPKPRVEKVKRKGKTTTKKSARRPIYFVVCFVQINNKRIMAAQDRAFAELLAEAKASRDPEFLRYLGLWGRPKRAVRVLDSARRDARVDVAGAANDALLLLREDKTRREIERVREQAHRAMKQKRYGAAAALWRPYQGVIYDLTISGEAKRVEREANEAAEHELATDPGGAKDLLRRSKGLPIEAKLRKLLEG